MAQVEILQCQKCSSYVLTSCCGKAVSCKPAKWSVGDAYGKYRRAYKRRYL